MIKNEQINKKRFSLKKMNHKSFNQDFPKIFVNIALQLTYFCSTIIIIFTISLLLKMHTSKTHWVLLY
jgi:hypothetical protein